MRRSGGFQPELRAHRPRQPRIGGRLARPRAFVEAAQHDEIEIQQPRFQRSQDREPRLRGCKAAAPRAASARSRNSSAY